MSVALLTATEMPSSFSSLLMEAMGNDSGGSAPRRDPVGVDRDLLAGDVHVLHQGRAVHLAVVPSEVAFAVDVMLPIVMNTEDGDAGDGGAGHRVGARARACDDEVADASAHADDGGGGGQRVARAEGAVWVGLAPFAPAVEAPLPRVALAVFPSAVLGASIDTPGWSSVPVFGVCGYRWSPDGPGRSRGNGTLDTSSSRSGPAFATTWPR